MPKTLQRVSKLTLAAAITGLLLAGCAAGNTSGNTSSSTSGSRNGPGMMGIGSSYHFSRLTCAAPANLPGHTVKVLLGDMAMTRMMTTTAPRGARMMLRAVPATMVAGRVSLVATNVGWRTHELVILPLSAGASVGARVPGSEGKVDESGSLGEASSSCGANKGDGIRAGTVGWTTLTLAPGRYELVCNLRNHYADGMREEIVVTSS